MLTIISFFKLFSEEVEHCRAWSNNYTQQIDLAFNMFFMVYYFIRVSVIILIFLLKNAYNYNNICTMPECISEIERESCDASVVWKIGS